MKYYLGIIICLCVACSNYEFDIDGYNKKMINDLQSISVISGIEKYEKFYYIVNKERDTIKVPSSEFESGVLYVNDIIKSDKYYTFILSSGNSSIIPCTEGAEIKYRVPNFSSLRLDGYDVQLKVVLKNINSFIRINHGEPNIGGLVCSSYIDFSKGLIGYYKPYTTDGEKTSEILIESEENASFIEGHEYTIVSSKQNGCVASLSIIDDITGEIYEFSPKIGCYESGITHSWGTSSYEVEGEVDVVDFKIYSNQDYHSKLLILGDSNAEHGGLGNYKEYGYTRRIRSEMNGSAFLVAQGGASTRKFLVWLDEYVLDLCKPQYCLITTYNETNFTSWHHNISDIIEILERENITPILATIHPAEGDVISNVHSEINDWIRNSGYLVFDVAKVISLNHDGVTTWKDVLTPPTWVHFNYESNNLLYENFFDSFPFMRAN